MQLGSAASGRWSSEQNAEHRAAGTEGGLLTASSLPRGAPRAAPGRGCAENGIFDSKGQAVD